MKGRADGRVESSNRWPDFFIVGAPRCGTSWLYRALRAHPGAYLPRRKEPHHLSPDLDGGTNAEAGWRIRSSEAYAALFRAARSEQRIGEASTGYLASEVAPDRIAALVPEARMVVLVRDPVEQISSLHARRVAAGVEDLGLEEALEAEADRRQGRRWPRRPVFMPQAQYREGARFGRHVQRYVSRFGRERVWVGLLDDIGARPVPTYRRVLDHLSLERRDPPALGRVNANEVVGIRRAHAILHHPDLELAVARMPRYLRPTGEWMLRAARVPVRRSAPRSPVPPELRDRLRAELGPDVEALGAYLGRDLVALWWGPGAANDPAEGPRAANDPAEGPG